MQNALRFGANCSAKASILANIFCGCGCKSGSNFLQREMQNHSKWQKSEGKACNVGRRFHHSAAFYIGFAR
jgi:lipoprotein